MSWTTPWAWPGVLLLTVVAAVSGCGGQRVRAAGGASGPDTAATMTTPTVAPTTTIPDAAAYCAAMARLLAGRGLGDGSGQYTQAALPYLQAAEEVAPGGFKAPFDTVIVWLRAGAPRPVPAAVSQAEHEGQIDYINTCH